MVEIDGERPSLTVYCFGSFQVYEDDHVIDEWASRKGKAIFKYLLMHRDRPVAKEQLMDLFWPNSRPDAARNNLNVAIYGLRQALRNGYPDFSHIIFQDDCYILNPEMRLWVDVDAFESHLHQGNIYWQQNQQEQAVYEYQAAASLYQGEFLAEDRYEEWVFPRRQQLQEAYLEMLALLSRHYLDNEDFTACIDCSQKILNIESCQEAAHRHLMQAYYRLGQAYLAIRQYHECVTALQTELDVPPEDRTTKLYESIRQRTY
jgi:DNA-binding SARP family transcriptional activator